MRIVWMVGPEPGADADSVEIVPGLIPRIKRPWASVFAGGIELANRLPWP